MHGAGKKRRYASTASRLRYRHSAGKQHCNEHTHAPCFRNQNPLLFAGQRLIWLSRTKTKSPHRQNKFLQERAIRKLQAS